MTVESRHHISGSLALAIGLAASAGFVDAWVYLNVTPVFVANMSGNLVRLGVFLGAGDWTDAVAASVALFGFLVGVGAATWSLDRHVKVGRPPRSGGLLLVESLILVGLLVALWATGASFRPTADAATLVVVVVAAGAMGLQAAALRRVGEVAVATTYGTGAVARIGEKVVLAIGRADRTGAHRRRVAIAVLCTVLVSYVAGAGIASLSGSSPLLLFLPAGILLVAAIVVGTSDRRMALGADSG